MVVWAGLTSNLRPFLEFERPRIADLKLWFPSLKSARGFHPFGGSPTGSHIANQAWLWGPRVRGKAAHFHSEPCLACRPIVVSGGELSRAQTGFLDDYFVLKPNVKSGYGGIPRNFRRRRPGGPVGHANLTLRWVARVPASPVMKCQSDW